VPMGICGNKKPDNSWLLVSYVPSEEAISYYLSLLFSQIE